MTEEQIKWTRRLLSGELYTKGCRCTGWWCPHDGFAVQVLIDAGLVELIPRMRRTNEGKVTDYYWCAREEFIELASEVHGKEAILSLLLEIET